MKGRQVEIPQDILTDYKFQLFRHTIVTDSMMGLKLQVLSNISFDRLRGNICQNGGNLWC
jgi:hypothetical protein